MTVPSHDNEMNDARQIIQGVLHGLWLDEDEKHVTLLAYKILDKNNVAFVYERKLDPGIRIGIVVTFPPLICDDCPFETGEDVAVFMHEPIVGPEFWTWPRSKDGTVWPYLQRDDPPELGPEDFVAGGRPARRLDPRAWLRRLQLILTSAPWTQPRWTRGSFKNRK